MDTYLLQRAGFVTQATRLEAADAAEKRREAEADWHENMLMQFPPVDPKAWSILKQQITVHRPVRLDDVSLEGIDLEQAHDQLYALSSVHDSDRFPDGYQAIRLEYADDKVAVLVTGLVKRSQPGGSTKTYKFLVEVLGTTREALERYAESVRPETPIETFHRELREIKERYKHRPHDSPRVERAARKARILDKRGWYCAITLVVAMAVGATFIAVSAFAMALSFMLVFAGGLFGGRLIHDIVLRRVGLPHNFDACCRGHYPPPLKASTPTRSHVVEYDDWM